MMKKIIFCCMVLLSAKTYGQGSAMNLLKRFEFGFKAGVNYSDFTDFSYATDPLIGFHGGGTVAFKITKNLMIQEDFLFSMEGAKNKSDQFGKQDFKLYYMSVPILLKYRTNFGLYVEAGIQAGFKVKEEVSGLSGSEFAKKIDVASVAGIGYQSKIGLGIGARYIYGMSKIGNFGTTAKENNLKNALTQVSLFYVFPW